RLSAPGGPEQHREGAIGHGERDALHRFDAAGVTLLHVLERHGRHGYFSVSTRPLTNQRCIRTTTATGGSIASIAVARTMFHSVEASEVAMIFLMPMTMVPMLSRVVISKGQRYWFQP